ncbi:LysE family translocator [Falsigemmobacter faecalis]|uniref:LysE family translocator n=1 Tax=Falsigemmobacter faecalis TaxID=2488730 RepID=A0A3P3D8T7_9RHOB|nr:LysE family translocator [Falsigemmobacter faecalis]RRH70234.1 LysE family translocator [Falsigemmobacter faecalis]
MSLTLQQLGFFALAMAGLWAVPGPVWVALVARALSGGFRGAVPLALGVAIGDLGWVLLALLGMAWVLSVYGDLLGVLRWLAALVFLVMGVLLLRSKAAAPGADSRLTRPGFWPGLAVGLAAVIGNPKAILFYMGFLPGFFDLGALTGADILAILVVAAAVPMIGNLALIFGLEKARALLQSERARLRLNRGSGALLILVGLAIPFV